MSLRVEPLTGAALTTALAEVARLRIAVFRAYPCLYDRDESYEEACLAAYADSLSAIDSDRLVGAATGAPMDDHAREFVAPFVERGQELTDIFYCGESALLPEYSGRGIGNAFFDHREAHGRALRRRWCCFCAVIRPDDHPARPEGYAPLGPFWRKRGCRKVPGLIAAFPWKELGATKATGKSMQFWIREP